VNGVRAFFAIAFEADVLRAVAAELARLRAQPGADALRFVRPEAVHVTLRFLGEIPREQVGPVAAASRTEVARVAPFAATLGGVHAFPSPRRPRVLALALEPEAPFAALAAAVERSVVATGFAPEPRGFRAHATLARLRPGRRLDPAFAAGPAPAAAPVSFPVREVVLFASTLAPDGATYTPLERMSLGGVDHPQSEASEE